MHCRNCGKEVAGEAVMCISCGVPPLKGQNFCQNCGNATNVLGEVCTSCGVRLSSGTAEGARSKMAAGLLGIFLGGLGIHRFYLGYTAIGIAQLVLALLGLVTCGVTAVAAHIWGLIEGILILTGSISKDGQGQPLKD